MVYVAAPVPPAVLEELYGEQYYSGASDDVVPGYRGYDAEEPIMRRNFERRLAMMRRFASPGPLLDVGCALGFFVRAARDDGWPARGVELSAHAARAAAASGLAVQQGDFLTMDLAPGSLTAVTMLDMLEHVASPRDYVRRARQVVRPGGLLVVETGDLGALYPRTFGRRWHFFTPPNHLSYFSRDTLRRLFHEEGFGEVTFFRMSKWVTVRRLLGHLYVQITRPAVKRLGDLAESVGVADLALPVNLGDDMLAIGRAT